MFVEDFEINVLIDKLCLEHMVIIISMIEGLIKVTLLSTAVARSGNYFNKSMFSYVSLLAY